VRLFVAVALDPELIRAAGSFVETLRGRAALLAPHARLSWVPPERFHVTLAFIGDVSESRAPAIMAALQPSSSVRPFEMTLVGAGAFPHRGRPRVLWTGVGEGRDWLISVAGEVHKRLTEAGVMLEARPFSPHVTVARVKEPTGLRSSVLLDGLTDVVVGRMTVDAITLFQSRLSPSSPSYHVMARSPLRREELS
jgi:2'-5' RNA ligase